MQNLDRLTVVLILRIMWQNLWETELLTVNCLLLLHVSSLQLTKPVSPYRQRHFGETCHAMHRCDSVYVPHRVISAGVQDQG